MSNTYLYEEKIHVAGRGAIYIGKYPSDFHIKPGSRLVIDGEERVVRGLERFATWRPVAPGDSIGVLVSAEQDQ